MKVIELVFLIGTQCVSPVQSAPGMTEVAKVQCAVVIEQDTETGKVQVSPESAAAVPKVAEAVKRLSTPVEASAPPPEQTAEQESDIGSVRVSVPAPPQAPVAQPPEPKAAETPPASPAPPRKEAALTPEKADTPDEPPAAQKPVEKRAGEATNICGAGRKAVWYTASPGHRKYRCRSADAGDTVTAKPAAAKPVATNAAPKKKSRPKKKASLY